MKFGRNDIHKKLRILTFDKAENMAGMTLVRLSIVAALAFVILISCGTYGLITGLIDSAPDISELSTAPAEAATYICDSDGSKIQKLTAPTSNRIPVSISQIPENMLHAIVAIEDERFYEHNGIDIRGILRAFVVGITGGSFSEGASTITQQLLKNSVFTDWTHENTLIDSLKRKLQEQYLAIQLEDNLQASMTKDEAKSKILCDYLNTINFGAGTYGIQAASQRYFNKDCSDLTLSECAVIAGITQNPTAYNPILYPESNEKRRVIVLSNMLEQGYITDQEYDHALADDVYSRIREASSVTDDSSSVYSYYTDACIDQVLTDLQNEKGYTSTQANNILYSGGLRIYTVQDKNIQAICDEEFANPDNFPSGTLIGLDYALSISTADGQTINYGNEDVQAFYEHQYPDFNMMFEDSETARFYAEQFKNYYVSEGDTVLGERISLQPQPQASCVVIDQSTGYVKAIVGGRGTKEASLTLNRATSSRRQPGSTFKPLAVYAPALESGNKTLASVYENAPYQYNSGTELKNWDSDYGYSGYETIRTALMKSVNVVAVKVLTELSPQTGLDYLERLGISTLYDGETDSNGNILTDAYQPLALGGITDGVVNLELTGAYAALANGGSYIEPSFYSRVEDSQGNIILDRTSPSGTKVFSEQTAYLMTAAMESVITDPLGTAYNYISMNMPAAGKTGTTDEAKDIWFEGYTPYYTCGIWGGYDNNDALPDYDKSYSVYAKVLWNSIMNRIHENLEWKDFTMPDGIETAYICTKSGKLATSGLCDADPRGISCIRQEYFKTGTAPVEYCDVHYSAKICTQTNLLASSTCTQTVNRVYLKLPAGSSTETEDALYTFTGGTCPGHQAVKIENKSDSDKSDNDKTLDSSGTGDDGTVSIPSGNEETFYPDGSDQSYYDWNSDGYSITPDQGSDGTIILY